jgi:hypothetical protein
MFFYLLSDQIVILFSLDIDEHSPDEDDRAAVTILKDVFGSKQKSVEMEEGI